ncbi:hypothetical protein CPC1998_0003A, partial [Chlamydia psittaci C19/98]
MIVTV